MRHMKHMIQQYFYSHSIRGLYIRFTLIFILFPVITISILSLYFTRKFVKEDYSRQYQDAIQNEIESQFSVTLKHAFLVIQNILTHNKIYTTLLDTKSDTETKTAFIEDELSAFLYNIETISGIELYTNTGDYYKYFKTDIIPYPNPRELFGDNSPSMLCISDEVTTDGENYYLVFGGKMYNYYNSYTLGNFIIYINQDNLQSFYKNLYNNGCEVFLTINGKIISHLDKSMLGNTYYLPDTIKTYVNTTHTFGKGYVIDSRQITLKYINSPIYLQTILSYNSILKDILRANAIIYSLVIIIFIISLILAIFIAHKLSKNIRRLQKNVTDVEAYLDKQNPLITDIPPKNELFLLENSFEEMRQKINSLLQANSTMLNNLRIAELNALQAQINPHFIYNALAAVSWTAKLQKQPQIVKLVSALSSYFRIGLHAGDTFITIREELKHVQSYIYVEQIRFPNLFDVVYNIDESILGCLITKIVLQPLVENSIKHGFKQKKAEGHLIINGYTDPNDDIILEVIDNGKGCERNPLESIQTKESDHYGLKNVQERLKITYGDDYGLTFESILNIKTCVQIKIKKVVPQNGGEDV